MLENCGVRKKNKMKNSFYLEIEESKINAFYELVETSKRYYKIMGMEMPKEVERIGFALENLLANKTYSINEDLERR